MTTTAATRLSPPMNHVFVDFENVHEVDPALIGARSVSLTLLLGARQTRLDAALVEKLMEHAATVQLVRLTSSGSNALDFALAYYLGRAVMADLTGYFHIVSKDTGFEPLMEHLRSRHIHAYRHDDFTTLTFSGPAKPPSAPPEELFTRVLEHLRKNVTARPKCKKKLVSHLLAFSGNTTTEADVLSLIERLVKAGHITIGDKDAVTYHFKAVSAESPSHDERLTASPDEVSAVAYGIALARKYKCGVCGTMATGTSMLPSVLVRVVTDVQWTRSVELSTV